MKTNMGNSGSASEATAARLATRHTPGPWKLDTVPTSGGSGSCHRIGEFPGTHVHPITHACVYADGIRIGIDEGSPRAVELLANARLIAAAPELLNALKLIMQEYQHIDPANENDPVFLARAAINKAEGKA